MLNIVKHLAMCPGRVPARDPSFHSGGVALITMLIYAAPLHSRSMPWFARPMALHRYCILAFLTVLMTYFGVNFLLGGIHSYA